MQDKINQYKAEFEQAVRGVKHALATTPENLLTWSPSKTSRSPLQVAAHIAIGGRDMLGNLTGNTFAIQTTEEAEKFHRERDSKVETLAECNELLDALVTDYSKWLDGLTESSLNEMMKLPFGMGEIPVGLGITFMPFHVHWHTAQINYIQTIYGDHDWHMPKGSE